MNKFKFKFFKEYNKKKYLTNKFSTIELCDIDEGVELNKDAVFNIIGTPNYLKIAKGVSMRAGFHILMYPNSKLIIKENVFFNNYCSVNCLGEIEIGENSLFGEGVKLYDHNHKYEIINSDLKVSTNEFKVGNIKIGKNCWIGSNVTILKDVEIGDNVIIGAHCLVYKSIPSNSIVKHSEKLLIETR